jgi:hypothetical protein
VKFEVSAPFRVQFLNPDDLDGTGIRTLSGRVAGVVDAADAGDAAGKTRAAVEERFPVRWALRIGTVKARPVTESRDETTKPAKD